MLRELLGEQGAKPDETAVVMAVGSAWGKAGEKNYKEKSEYYRKSGVDRRK